MKVTLEVGRDEDLRNEVLRLIKLEVKNISNDEIRKMTQDHLAQVNVAAKVTSTIKELLNKQIDSLAKGYGDIVIKHNMDKKMDEWMEKSFAAYFDNKCIPFIKGLVEEKFDSFTSFLDVYKKITSKR